MGGFKEGDRIITTDDGGKFYQEGAIGTVEEVGSRNLLVQFDKECSYQDGRWFVDFSDVMVIHEVSTKTTAIEALETELHELAHDIRRSQIQFEMKMAKIQEDIRTLKGE